MWWNYLTWWEIFENFSWDFSPDWDYIIKKYWKYVDHIMETTWIELEKCSWKKRKIWEVNGNAIFIYEISKKYIKENSAEIFIYIWWKRKNNYRISFEYDVWKMITWDYLEERFNRIENSIIFYDRILIQDKKTKLWKNMWNKTKEFNKELDKIIKLIKMEYLNPELNK